MSILDDFKKDIVADLSQPDAEKAPEPQTQPRKRGPYKKRNEEGGKPLTSRKNATSPELSQGDFEAGAKGLNTGIFVLACSLTGSQKAWPVEDQAKIMDKALARYLEIKNKIPPAELMLITAYGGWIKTVVTDPDVKESTEKRFGGKLARFKHIFKKKGATQ